MTVRALVVEDEPDVEALFRQQFRRELRDGVYTLDFALSASAALAILDDAIGETIILLVSDINMPSMSGLDLLPIVKACRPDLPVFMMSAYGDAATVTTALALERIPIMLQHILHERRIWRHFGGQPSHELPDAAAKRIPETESPAKTPPFRTPWDSRFNPNGNRSRC